MGCTASKSVENGVLKGKHATKGSVDTVTTAALSTKGAELNGSKHGKNNNKKPIINLDIRNLAQEKWKVNRGYSSGASSFASDDDTKEDDAPKNVITNFDPKSIARPSSKSLLRNVSEVSCLSELKDEFATTGDLAKTIVRMETPFDTPIEEIYDGVLDGKILGTGVSGTVRMITHRATGIKYAVKCLDLGLINTPQSLLQLRNEIFIMCQLDHPNVMRIEEVYESNDELYIVQEICNGGDLFDRLDIQPNYHYTEAQCAKLVKQMLSSVRYLHSKGIIHRDLKLENFLFSTPGDDSELKLIDFGLSKHFEIGQSHCEKVGTPYTVAPEILRGNYDEKSDIWSLGVITYLLLCGETPFGGLDGENLLIVKENIMRAKVLFEPTDMWDLVSDDGKAFVKSLLNADASKRPTAKEAQRCTWIQEYAKKDAKEGNQLNPKTVGALLNFKESSDMQKLLSEVLSFTLLPEQIVELRKEFEKLDSHGDGEITLGSLKRILMQNAEVGALGALTETEVEDLFNSIKVPTRKAETTIRWHEFLAACLSRAEIDDRNLRLAFDRLDADRKGFITFDDISDVLGTSTEYEVLEKIWEDSLLEINSRLDRITLADFKKLMKGRPKEGMTPFLQSSPGLVPTYSDTGLIPALNELCLSDVQEEEMPDDQVFEITQNSFENMAKVEKDSEMKQDDIPSANTADVQSSSIKVMKKVPVPTNRRWSSLDPEMTPWSARRSSTTSPFSSTFAASTVSDPITFSPLAASRAVYRKSLLQHSYNEAISRSNKSKEFRKSGTRASLIMKRGSLLPSKKSLVDNNPTNDTTRTLETVSSEY